MLQKRESHFLLSLSNLVEFFAARSFLIRVIAIMMNIVAGMIFVQLDNLVFRWPRHVLRWTCPRRGSAEDNEGLRRRHPVNRPRPRRQDSRHMWDLRGEASGRRTVQLLLRMSPVPELHNHPARWRGAVHGGDRKIPPRRNHDRQVIGKESYKYIFGRLYIWTVTYD